MKTQRQRKEEMPRAGESREQYLMRMEDLRRDRLVWAALKRWGEWLLTFYSIVPKAESLKTMEKEIDNTHESVNARMPKAVGTHSDPTLAKVLADEKSGYSWPMSIHGLIWDMPRTHRLALLGTALGINQQAISEACGVTQGRISTVLKIARSRLAISLLILEVGNRRRPAGM